MVFGWLPWLLANEFKHMESFTDRLLKHETTPPKLAHRLHKRIKRGNKLIIIRVGLYAIVYSAVLAIAASLVFVALEDLVGGTVVSELEAMFAFILRVLSFFVIAAVIALVIVSRALALLRVDIYFLSMEAVALSIKAGGPKPSTQRVRMKTK